MVVNGHDIIRLGITGPQIGQTLNALLDEIVNGTLPNEREELLEAARKRMKVR